MITIKIAGLAIAIENKYSHVENIAKDYLTDENPLFTVSVSEEEIKKEREETQTDFPLSYYESTVAYRKIAEKLPEYDAFLFHGCVIELDEKAYVITARSGVGKTTHTRLWLSEFGDEVSILNGDKPIIRIIDSIPYACGTPWRGKENYGKNSIRRLAGFAFLSRADKNNACAIEPKEAVMRFMSQIYLPRDSRAALAKTMLLADKVISGVRLVQLECNTDPEAARVCRAALT